MTRRHRGLSLSVALSLLLLATLLGAAGRAGATPPAAASGGSQDSQLCLKSVVRGDAAVRALGARLSGVARVYDLPPDRLRSLLLEDGSLAVDRSGRLFYACGAEPAPPVSQGPVLPPARAFAPAGDTFRLHSLPGADRVIYLDFNGGTLRGCVWNELTGVDVIACPAWNTEGSAGTFSAAERAVVQNIWRRVAEDYAPFAVDVTTEAPSADRVTRSSEADDLYGTRVLVSPISAYFGRLGGVAYVGVYDAVDEGDFYKPALVFPERLANNEKTIAEAISHEAGHNLGLSHDGVTNGPVYYTGRGQVAGGWAPIMGAGYAKTLSQWSRGEYAHANNREDDLEVMQGHGLALRTDDHGDTALAATLLPAGAALSARGVVETAADVDVLAFTAGAGPARFSVKPASRGPNLDIRADVLAADGRVLATSNRSDALAASLSMKLPTRGTYYLCVQGVGKGNPLLGGYSDYGSLGTYVVAGSVVPPPAEPGP